MCIDSIIMIKRGGLVYEGVALVREKIASTCVTLYVPQSVSGSDNATKGSHGLYGFSWA